MSANIHASCVAFRGKGVLLLGPSGAGKSDLALRLIDGGARLVADDRCALFLRGGKLCARAPASIAGLIEMRGLGIIALPHAKSAAVALAVRLGGNPRRLPEAAFYEPPAGLAPKMPIPLIQVKAEAASAPARIRAALTAFAAGRFRDTFNMKSRT
jgi:serine kinase of HPr protein (carbohydrate metabolism regulator)